MKQYAENGRVGVCHELRKDEMYVRTYSGGYPYLNDGVVVRSSSAQPIYSYGKNYEKNGSRFGLFVWTTNGDARAIEKLFESSLSSVTDDNISEVSGSSAFVYLN